MASATNLPSFEISKLKRLPLKNENHRRGKYLKEKKNPNSWVKFIIGEYERFRKSQHFDPQNYTFEPMLKKTKKKKTSELNWFVLHII